MATDTGQSTSAIDVLDAREFYGQYIQEIPLSFIANYFNQEADMRTYNLFFKSVEIYSPERKVVISSNPGAAYVRTKQVFNHGSESCFSDKNDSNDPSGADCFRPSYKYFEKLLEAFFDADLIVEHSTTTSDVGPKLADWEVGFQLQGISTALTAQDKDARLALKAEDDGTFHLQKTANDDRFCLKGATNQNYPHAYEQAARQELRLLLTAARALRCGSRDDERNKWSDAQPVLRKAIRACPNKSEAPIEGHPNAPTSAAVPAPAPPKPIDNCVERQLTAASKGVAASGSGGDAKRPGGVDPPQKPAVAAANSDGATQLDGDNPLPDPLVAAPSLVFYETPLCDDIIKADIKEQESKSKTQAQTSHSLVGRYCQLIKDIEEVADDQATFEATSGEDLAKFENEGYSASELKHQLIAVKVKTRSTAEIVDYVGRMAQWYYLNHVALLIPEYDSGNLAAIGLTSNGKAGCGVARKWLAAADMHEKDTPNPYPQRYGYCYPLIMVEQGHPQKLDFVSVNYGSHSFRIPKEDQGTPNANETYQVFKTIHDLIAYDKVAKDLAQSNMITVTPLP
jgi:hypothetical protein